MENDIPSPAPGASDPAAGARDALASLEADAVHLADRVITPWWYHPILAVLVALIMTGLLLPPFGTAACTATGILGMVLLMRAYGRVSGVVITQAAGPRGRALLWALVGILAAAFIAVVVIANSGASGWWAALAIVPTAVAVIVLGRRYDDSLRRELPLA
ncbi:hypothetical protein [Agromyces seonyuensis]|uniref:Transmembrane protein n=1 Tax=Agromyces seonyuensis TaxID=2662446 RepID=A0A6I4NXE2_9MICO|nr:hypothetical protein [Agromyces seonyuensis]MWB98990.1 hypothetical protein [Agromyces seonyuensis]